MCEAPFGPLRQIAMAGGTLIHNNHALTAGSGLGLSGGSNLNASGLILTVTGADVDVGPGVAAGKVCLTCRGGCATVKLALLGFKWLVAGRGRRDRHGGAQRVIIATLRAWSGSKLNSNGTCRPMGTDRDAFRIASRGRYDVASVLFVE